MVTPTLALHGGAGVAPQTATDDAQRAEIRNALRACLTTGQRILRDGGSALDAVTETVAALENDPAFNAGRGSVFTASGTMEMDAAIMDGQTRRLGAVAGILGPRNPIRVARAVLEHAPHVLLIGAGALDFAARHALPFEPEAYFATSRREAALARVLQQGARDEADRHGTVGAVAIDRYGHLAAATSTGGMTAKWPGRVGDTPIAGAGTWADATVAISATGHGESFIRLAAAHEISARLRLARQDLATATSEVLQEIAAIGGSGGLIAIDRHGNVALPFDGDGMYRGIVTADGPPRCAIHHEPLA